MMRTPRQKKSLSYERDRRNAYGQNAKASRKAIPARKAGVRRAYRHAVKQRLHDALIALDPDEAQAKVASVKLKRWRKSADIPLKEHIARQLILREVRWGRKPDKPQPPSKDELEFRALRKRKRAAFLGSLQDSRAEFRSRMKAEHKALERRLRGARQSFEKRLLAMDAPDESTLRLACFQEEKKERRDFQDRVNQLQRDFLAEEMARIERFK